MTRKLIKGGHVISMDTEVGTGHFDVLVEDDRIVEVAPGLDAHDAELIDASGCVVIPGLVNAHMHTWQTALRGLAANWTLPQYFRSVHAGLATLVPQQSNSGAHRPRNRRAARVWNPQCVLSRLTEARPETRAEAFQRNSSPAKRN
jgi:predicted amidohydrolase YtcJ